MALYNIRIFDRSIRVFQFFHGSVQSAAAKASLLPQNLHIPIMLKIMLA